MHARLCGPNNLLIPHHDFPCLADEIAEPRPDMNIKLPPLQLAKSLLILNKLTNASGMPIFVVTPPLFHIPAVSLEP